MEDIMANKFIVALAALFGLVIATPALAETTTSAPTTEATASAVEATNPDPLASDEAWNAALDSGKTDVQLFGRREIAPGIFAKRMEMRSLAEKGCFVGGDVIGNDPKIAKLIAAGLQCTDKFRDEVNGRKKAGSTTFYVHQMMLGYSIRIDKRGSKEQGNSTCDAFSPFGSTEPIAFACFNDMSGHQRVMGFVTAVGQDLVRGGINFGLMRAQRPNKTIIENGSGSNSGSSSGSNSGSNSGSSSGSNSGSVSGSTSAAKAEDGGVVVNNNNVNDISNVNDNNNNIASTNNIANVNDISNVNDNNNANLNSNANDVSSVNDNTNNNANANANANNNQNLAGAQSSSNLGIGTGGFDPNCPTSTCH
jgi:hypothetical protein